MIVDYLGLSDKASLIESGTLLSELVVRTGKLDERDEDCNAILHVAVEQGYERTTEYLLGAGAPANSRRGHETWSHDTTPLLLASRQGNLDIVNMLLEYGASIHEWEWSGVYPLHHAAEHGHTQIVQLFLDLGAKQISNFDIGSPIHLAAANGHAEVVRTLTAHGEDASTLRWGVTPLSMAVFGGHLDCVRALLEAGVDAKYIGLTDWFIPPALLMAAGGPHFRSAAEIAYDTRVSEICRAPVPGWPLGQKETHAEMVRLLATSGADVSQELDSITALHLAAVVGSCLAVKFLLRAGADVHRRTRSGWSALMFARVLGHEDTVQLLLPVARRERYRVRKPAIPPKPNVTAAQLEAFNIR